MIIPETRLKIKSFVILVLKAFSLVIILGTVFLLGRISVLSSQNQETRPIQVIYPPLVKNDIPKYQEMGNSSEPETWTFAGSKTGKTYYSKGCTGLNRIKPENRVYFITAQDAETAGYHISATCK